MTGEAGQGRHIDPEAPGAPPPQRTHWSPPTSTTMEVFADCLRPPGGGTVREGVIDDLGSYYGLTADQVVERCLGWEAESIREWHAARRDTAAGLADFYDTVQSWSFDLLWYAYLQTAGYPYPASVIVADTIGTAPGGRMLDFGSGAGVAGQFFAALGWDVTMADVSAALLEFASWRHQRRGLDSNFLRLPADLPDHAFDLITAIDVFAHIPDVGQTARQLHRAMRPGGLLVTNFDVRPASAANAWHLYEHAAPLRWALERVGFAPVRLIDGFTWFYRAEPAGSPATRLRTALAWARLASPPSRVLRRAVRSMLRPAARSGSLLMSGRGRIRRGTSSAEQLHKAGGSAGPRSKAMTIVANRTFRPASIMPVRGAWMPAAAWLAIAAFVARHSPRIALRAAAIFTGCRP